MQTQFSPSSIKQLSNQELLSRTKLLIQEERNLHIQVLNHLKEINSRKLYLRRGFSSLFDYAVKELGYSEGAAYRRIQAMKLCQELPETEDRLQTGKLNLTAACELQTFFERQVRKAKEKTRFLDKPVSQRNQIKSSDKEQNQELFQEDSSEEKHLYLPLNKQQKQNLIERVEGCSVRSTRKLLSEADPSFSHTPDQVRFPEKGKVEIKITMDESCYKKLEELKNLLSHKNPKLSYGELLLILSEEGLNKYDPRRKKIRKNKIKTERKQKKTAAKLEKPFTSLPEPTAFIKESVTSSEKLVLSIAERKQKQIISRAIPAYLQKYIWERDGGKCSYVHRETKRRCSSKYLLQIDHIQPFALGGKTEKENLRLFCAAHNQYRK